MEEKEKKNQKSEPEFIAKPKFMRRVSAFIIDLFICLILFFGFNAAISKPVSSALKLDYYEQQLADLEEEHGIMWYDEDGKMVFTDDQEKIKEFKKLDEYHKIDVQIIYRSLAGTVIILFLPCLITFYIIPLAMKNGQTLGKKVFGIGVLSIDGYKMKNWQFAVRFFIGFFLFEVVLSINHYAPMGGLLLSFFICLFTKKKTAIHDILGRTIVVDLTQTPVYDSKEEREKVLNVEQ